MVQLRHDRITVVVFFYNSTENNILKVVIMGELRDRTGEIGRTTEALEVERNEYCSAYVQDTNRLFASRECWYCKYGDFGIYTEHPTQYGLCRYKK